MTNRAEFWSTIQRAASAPEVAPRTRLIDLLGMTLVLGVLAWMAMWSMGCAAAERESWAETSPTIPAREARTTTSHGTAGATRLGATSDSPVVDGSVGF